MLEKTIDLFNFSKIKSECIYHMADYNMFKYDFSNNEQISSKNTYINSPMKDTRRHYIKKVIVNIPSNDKLKEDNFKNDFLYNYESSFANFCGLSEKTFTKLYEKNVYIPQVDRMGDIKLYIGDIINVLNTFSGSKRLKIKRRKRIKKFVKIEKPKKGNKKPVKDKQKIFKITKNIRNKDFNIIPINENDLDHISNDIKSNDSNSFTIGEVKDKKNLSNSISLNGSDSKDSNKSSNKNLLNIKRKLKNIIISKDNIDKQKKFDTTNTSLEQRYINNNYINVPNNTPINDLSSSKNLNLNNQDNLNIDLWPLSHDNKKYKSFQHEDGFKFSSNSNENNIFNFSSNIIQDYNNNCIKKDNPDYHIYKPLNNNFSNNNIEGNNDINYSPYGPIFSPFYSPKKMSHLLSQNLNAISPYNINLFGNTYIFNFKNSDGNNANEDNNNNIYNSIYDNNNNDKTKNESNQNLDKIKDEKTNDCESIVILL